MHTQKALLKKVRTGAISVLSDIYPPLPQEIKSHSPKKRVSLKMSANKEEQPETSPRFSMRAKTENERPRNYKKLQSFKKVSKEAL